MSPDLKFLMERVLALFGPQTHTLFNPVNVPMYTPPISSIIGQTFGHPPTPEEIAKEQQEKTEVEAFMTKMEPELKVQTEALIKEEIHEMLLMGGNRQRILELLRAGKIPKLVRKKEGRRDPLFLQFGDGQNEPIEEMQILG